MKFVAGTKWVNQHIQRLKGLGRWMKAGKESESFRFGDGHELRSQYAYVFEATGVGDPSPLETECGCGRLSTVAVRTCLHSAWQGD